VLKIDVTFSFPIFTLIAHYRFFKESPGIPCGPGYTLNLLPKDTAAIPDAFDQAWQTLAALQDCQA